MKLLSAILALALAAGCAQVQEQQPVAPVKLRVVSDTAVTGFTFPESVGCDATEKVLYVSNFGGAELKPADKDGRGFISKVGLDGKVIDAKFLPRGRDILNKPKGIFIQGSRMWVTDIDSVWIYDTKTRAGRKLALPGIQFANDPAVVGNALYVSDNRADQLFRVEPADFLAADVKPMIQGLWAKKNINPNGIWPSRNGQLLLVGFLSADQARGIYAMGPDGEPKPISQAIGRLDGLYEMRDGSLLVTDWNSGSLFRWTASGGVETLAKDFKGPADFCVMPTGDGYTVYVPDLVKSEIRIIRLGR